MARTTNYQEALTWALPFGAEGITPSVWIPESGFEFATKNSDGSVSFTRDGFGLGVGPDPIIEDSWQRFALSKALPKEKTISYKLVNRWNPYRISTEAFSEKFGTEKISEAGIKEFLDENAPESSVYPGNSEVIFWAGIKVDGDLKAVGCICTWESGARIISSIATKISERNKGYGSALTKGILALANEMGINEVFLAVNAKNEVAARVYEKIGFESLGKFNTFER